MNARRHRINERIALEKEGWRRDGDWWVTGHGYANAVHDFLASSVEWIHRLETELMLAGWVFAAFDDLFIAHHRDTGAEFQSPKRDEAVGLAYLLTPIHVELR